MRRPWGQVRLPARDVPPLRTRRGCTLVGRGWLGCNMIVWLLRLLWVAWFSQCADIHLPRLCWWHHLHHLARHRLPGARAPVLQAEAAVSGDREGAVSSATLSAVPDTVVYHHRLPPRVAPGLSTPFPWRQLRQGCRRERVPFVLRLSATIGLMGPLAVHRVRDGRWRRATRTGEVPTKRRPKEVLHPWHRCVQRRFHLLLHCRVGRTRDATRIGRNASTVERSLVVSTRNYAL